MGRRVKKKTKVELEDYERFLHNPYDQDLSIDQLNQIIFMHGFKKIHKRRKIELYEALRAIDLVKPQRSTINDKLSPYDSSLSLDQVKQDLEALEWQECPVQSVQVINPSHEINGCDDRVLKGSASSSFKISRKKKRSKRQRRSSSIVNDGGDSQGNNVVDGDVAVGDGTGSRALFVDTYNWEF